MSLTFTSLDKMVTAVAPSIAVLLEFLVGNDLALVLKADHICYKCASAGEYDAIRSILESSSQFLYMHQSIISGRRVAYFRFAAGFPFGANTINYLELSDKKLSEEEDGGFHHVELYPTSGTLQQLMGQLQAEGIQGILKERPHHTTYDVLLPEGFIARFCDGPLIEKIAQEILL